MTVIISWQEIAIRIALTLLAGGLIGLNRGVRGSPAGLRTTLLVCLAASIAMIQANLLLDMSGTPGNSSLRLDVMRLPLGILTGMGFIGGGAILRKDNMVTGVTTAATLWFVTVVGLCFGGGQLALGLIALALGFLILWLLRSVEKRMKQEERGELVVVSAQDGPGEDKISTVVADAGARIAASSILLDNHNQIRRLRFDVRWRKTGKTPEIPRFIERLAQGQGVERVEWNSR